MIEIQCTSCHTRYRIDERVLPADSPTFKCSRCGHVFTTDPVAAKKLPPEASSKPPAPRASSPRIDPKPAVTPAVNSIPEAPRDTLKSVASEEPPTAAKPHAGLESKPAPIKPYIRNQRPTVFDRTPEPPPPKPSAELSAEIDSATVASMRAAVDTPTPSTTSGPPHRASEPPKPQPRASQAKDSESDEAGENLEFDFNDENQPELGIEAEANDAPAAPERWSVGDDAIDMPAAQQSTFGSGELDPAFSRGEPAPIGRGTIPQYAGSDSIQHSPLPDERAFMESAGLRSARSFIGLFVFVMATFVVLTGIVCLLPSASAELLHRMPMIGPEFVQTTPLENLIGVSEVQSNYQAIKGGQQALVLTGVVKNNSEVPLHTVQIGVRLLDAAQHDIASSAVYCGTTLSPRMIGEMTPHELEFLQKLDPQKNFVLEAGHAAPFLMVFIDPPRNLSHFAVAITKAQPATVQSGPQASARR